MNLTRSMLYFLRFEISKAVFNINLFFFPDISLELLDHTIHDDSFVSKNAFNNNLTISLDDIYDTISLYDDFGANQRYSNSLFPIQLAPYMLICVKLKLKL